MALKFDDLWRIWLEAHDNPPSSGEFQPIQMRGDNKSYWLTPEDMTVVLNANTPLDLFLKPNSMPARTDYATSAFNIQNPIGKLGINNAILMARQNPKSRLSQIVSMSEQSKSYPREMRQFFPQAVYEHEVAHNTSNKILPKFGNKGYLVRGGLPGSIYAREEPAMAAEEKYWKNNPIVNDLIKRGIIQKKK